MAKIWIDGRPVEAAEGTHVLAAARAAGIDLPSACDDARLNPMGACRLCLVREEGKPKQLAACALPVVDGMRIEARSPDLEAERRGLLRMLARTYPREAFEAAPEKPLHRWFRDYGVTEFADRESLVDDSHPYFQFDPQACIECYRCVRICSELQGSDVWQIVGRGFEAHVAPDSFTTMVESTCKSCGACSDSCPSGALIDKHRLVSGIAEKWTRTTCPYCGVGCELSVGTREGRVTQVLPVLEAPVSKGHLCVKGRYAHEFVHAPDRATTPMVRKEGKLVPVSWEEALATVAEGFKKALASGGPAAVGVLGSARATNEDNYIAQKFARVVLSTNNVDCCARVCHAPSAAAMKEMLGTGAATNSFNDIEVAAGLMVVGSNPTENHPIVGERMIQARRKGAKLIVIDPRRTELAAIADVHVALRPGTNVPLLHAMAHTILSEGLVDEAFLSTRVAEVEEFKQFVEEWTPERASEISGVPAETIRTAAHLYATTKPMMCCHGLGMTEHLQGTEGVQCLVNLALLTGNMGKPGSGINPLRGQNNVQGSAHMGCEPSNLAGFVSIEDGAENFESVWGCPVPRDKGLTQLKMLDAAIEGSFKALYAVGYDVYFTNANAHETRRAFEAMDLVVIQDLFLNETAKEFAHVFLPACSSFEHEGTFMNAERRVQRVRQAVPALGESKADWEITRDLAREMGFGEFFPYESAENVWEEVRRVWKPGAGMSYARLESGGLQWPCPTEDHPGTTILHKERFPIGERAALRRIPYIPTSETVNDEFPLLLNTGRNLYHFNAGTMTYRTRNERIRPSDTLDLNPSDAARLGLSDGEEAEVVSRYGHCVLPVHVDSRIRPGEAFSTFHSVGRFVNKVTGPTRDRRTGAPEYKVTAVRVEKVR